jgi:hypothetical protein
MGRAGARRGAIPFAARSNVTIWSQRSRTDAKLAGLLALRMDEKRRQSFDQRRIRMRVKADQA